MDLTPTLPAAVYMVWSITLLAVVLVIVPLAIVLLHRTLRAALSIHRYLREMLQAGVGIAENTSSIKELNHTISVAGSMVGTAGSINQHTGIIATVLSERAAVRRLT